MTEQSDNSQTRVGPYLVQDVIGTGPHGIVYSVLHEEKHQRLTLKRLHEPVSGRPGETFNRIAKVVVALTHPAIANVGHIVLHGRHVAIIGEVVDGRCLSEVLAVDGPLEPADCLGLARQICAGLQYAHQRCVYHTSLRPENVFLMPDGGVRITDFAIAALYGQSVRRRPRYSAKQEMFFAPEFREKGIIHPPSDVYSLGALLYATLRGVVPVAQRADGNGRFAYLEVEGAVATEDGLPALDVNDLPPATPPELVAAIAAALAPDPARRPGSVNEFAEIMRGTRGISRLSRHARRSAEAAQGPPLAPGPRVRVCSACRRPVSPAGRVCLACGLVLREAPEPTQAVGYFHRHGRRLLAKGEIEAAESAYRKGVERNPREAALHNELGDVLAVQNRFDEAVECYRRAVKLAPKDDDAWHDLGVSLAALQRRREAREALERAAELTARDEVRLSSLLHLGSIAADEGRAGEAVRLWERVLREDPGLVPVRMALASTYASLSDYDGAEEQLRAVLSIEPELLEAQNLLARVRERSQLERQDVDRSFGLIDDMGGGEAYLRPGFRWLRLR
ncbi:MAG: protein kinase domain-containing protein [Armatimonadota bacterium]|jgi:tetratricopeptide (TPR) repeat protein